MRAGLVILILVISQSLWASHIIGGNFKITQTGRNNFNIDLTVFRDCGSVGNPVQLQDILTIIVYDRDSLKPVVLMDISKFDSTYIDLGDNCYTPTGLCVQEIHMLGDTTLPDRPSGYLIVAQVCCRNIAVDNLVNPASTGITWTAEIPDPGLFRGNSTPDLGEYPPSGYLCLGYTRRLDLSATDPDGDSLRYEVISPLNNAPAQPPFNDVNFRPGFTAQTPISGNPGLSIDFRRGELVCKPNQLGVFVFAYEVTEYRNGIRIGSVRRDLQLEVLPCVIDQPPVFLSPADSSFSAEAREKLCTKVLVVDSNLTDTIFLTTSYDSTVLGTLSQPPNFLMVTDTASTTGQICWTPSCLDAVRGKRFTVRLKAVSNGCEGPSEAILEYDVELPPLNDHLEEVIPNVFTPNGDGVNDLYQLKNQVHSRCLNDLIIMIYNRWGVKVYESTLGQMAWDGTYEGQPVSEGVYFYVLNGNYGDGDLTFKKFITLLR